jgi:hypothetical protein
MKRTLVFLSILLPFSGLQAIPIDAADAVGSVTPVVALVQTLNVPAAPADGMTNLYLVHGLNLAGQAAQIDGGTPMTVCVDGTQLNGDFEFGDIVGPVSLETGATVAVDVFSGATVDCAALATPVIRQDVTVPDVGVAALIATSSPGPLAPEILPVKLTVTAPDFCSIVYPADVSPVTVADPGQSRLQAVHAAALPAVSVTLDDAPLADLNYGDTISDNLAPGTYSPAVLIDDKPVAAHDGLAIGSCTSAVIYVVGDLAVTDPPQTSTSAASTTTPPARVLPATATAPATATRATFTG